MNIDDYINKNIGKIRTEAIGEVQKTSHDPYVISREVYDNIPIYHVYQKLDDETLKCLDCYKV